MAARNLSEHQWALEHDTVKLYGRGTGAATDALTSLKGKGISLVDQTDTGKYTITLTDKWAGFLMFKGMVIDPGSPADWEVVVESETVASTKLVKIVVFKDGTAANLTSDEKLLFEITVCPHSHLPKGY